MNETCYDYSTFKAYIWFKQLVYVIFTYTVHREYIIFALQLQHEHLNL